MGRIKTWMIKRLGEDLLRQFPDKFCEDFDKNKEVLKDLLEIKSKKLRNVLAGYITKVMKKKSVKRK